MNEILKAINSMPGHTFNSLRQIETNTAITSLARKYKFTKIGEGFYAVVYKHENYPFVVKVWRQDEGFDMWLNFVLNNQNNPYVPKVKGKPVRITGTEYKAIRLEYLIHPKMREKHIHDVIEILWKSEDPNMKKIVRYLKSTGRDDDMHSENIMQRPNGQWVITDPLAW